MSITPSRDEAEQQLKDIVIAEHMANQLTYNRLTTLRLEEYERRITALEKEA